jgi:hypothetical protein
MTAQRVGLLFLFCIVLCVASAGAQSVESIANDHDLSAREREQILAVFEHARELDIPSEFLLPRLQEGLRKRVPPPRLAAALTQDLERLRSARVLLRRSSDGRELLQDRASWARTANLLRYPLSEREVEVLVDAADGDPGSYRSGSALYVQLREWGVEEIQSAALTKAALESDLPESEYPGILEILVRGRQDQLAVDRIVERLVIVLPNAQRLRTVERTVLE